LFLEIHRTCQRLSTVDAFVCVDGVIDENWTGRILEQGESLLKDCPLELRIYRVSQRSAEGKSNPKGPGRFYGERVLANQADLGGGNPLCLNVMCKPAYSARAVWSHRYEENGVNPVLFHDRSEVAGLFIHLKRVGRSHE